MSQQTPVPHQYVDAPPALDALVARLRGASRIALDTEADSLHSYYEKVCLIQLAVEGEAYIVDPLAGLDLAGLLEVLATTPLLFHGADYDLRMLRTSLQLRPRGEVHDTAIAAQLVGIEQFGLAALAQRFCNVTLPKASRKADWARRPLSPHLLAYAVDDVRYLERIAEQVFAELRGLGRYGWYREACERQVEACATDRQRDAANAWRIKGLRGLGRRQLAFVRELWHWREREAQQADRPSFKIIGNRQLLELALWAEGHPESPLSRGPRLPRHFTGHRLRSLEKAIPHAHALPKDQWPEHPRSSHSRAPEPGFGRRVDALMALCARTAGELGIAPSVLAPRAALEALAASRPGTKDDMLACGRLMRWQVELLAPAALEIVARTPPAKEATNVAT